MTAEQIRDLRLRLELSTMAFAIRLAVSVDTVRKYEQGKRRPTDRIMRLLEALDVTTPARQEVAV